MRLQKIYELIVGKGLEKDPRSKKQLKRVMDESRRAYRALGSKDRKYFDKEKLNHPFADTRILHGDRKRQIRNILVGIDMGIGELLTAHMLNERGAGIDLALSHHPSGKALSNLHDVMNVHTDILHNLGLDMEVAKSLMKDRIDEVSRRFQPINYDRDVDIAKLLDIPFMCVHTPADNHVTHFLQKLIDRKKPKRVRTTLDILKGIPEYQHAMYAGVGPRLIAGKEENVAGRVFVDMTGGTEGSKKIFARLSQAGIKTIVAMHLSEEHFKSAKSEFLNIIVAGHIASDTIGMNLVLDEVAKAAEINIIPCSGFVRVKR